MDHEIKVSVNYFYLEVKIQDRLTHDPNLLRSNINILVSLKLSYTQKVNQNFLCSVIHER